MGTVPYRESSPVITNIFVPCSAGSNIHPGSFFLPLSWKVSWWVKGAEGLPAVSDPALIQIASQVTLRSYLS